MSSARCSLTTTTTRIRCQRNQQRNHSSSRATTTTARALLRRRRKSALSIDVDEDGSIRNGVGTRAVAKEAAVDDDDDVECVQRTVLECMRTELREASNELLALRHHLRETEEDADKYRASYEFCASRGGVESVRDRLAMLENANGAAHATKRDLAGETGDESRMRALVEEHGEIIRQLKEEHEKNLAAAIEEATNREQDTAQAVSDAMQHMLDESETRNKELEENLARALKEEEARLEKLEAEILERLRAAERIGAMASASESDRTKELLIAAKADRDAAAEKCAVLERTLEEFEKITVEAMIELEDRVRAVQRVSDEKDAALDDALTRAERAERTLERAEAERDDSIKTFIEEFAIERTELEGKIQALELVVEQNIATESSSGQVIEQMEAAYKAKETAYKEQIAKLKKAASIGMEILSVKDAIASECQRLHADLDKAEDEKHALAMELAELRAKLE